VKLDRGRRPAHTGVPPVDVLIVGAGPTGLALAAQLQMFGTRVRIVDRSLDRARESRALAVQARTLEVLDAAGLGDALVSHGRTSTRLVLHFGARTVAEVQLGDIGATDTRFPFILFVSQAETEHLLSEHLVRSGITIERGVELTQFTVRPASVDSALRHQDGREELVCSRFLVGCDGAHSTVRRNAGFVFEGGSYPQEFVLGDVEADGPLEPGAINSFVGGGSVAMFFPLGKPTTWRVIAMKAAGQRPQRGERPPDDDSPPGALTLDELQSIVAPPTEASVTVRDPAWLTHFRLHHRQIAHYRKGPVFLAGDAAHIHSPVGAQGMNTGIQDAWNLGWKLALVARGAASPRLLDSYEAERWPVGRFLLRYTDRIFGAFTRAMSGSDIATWARELIVPKLLPSLLGSARLRAATFRFVSELAIHYRRSPAVVEGEPRLRAGPRAGDRLPDARLTRDERAVTLQRLAVRPHLTLLLCGDRDTWDATQLTTLRDQGDGLIDIVHLSRRPTPGALVDQDGELFAMLGARRGAQYLVRPDGYIAFRCAGHDLEAARRYLAEWFPRAPDGRADRT
jgi:2-polyprenyl-6-methoxyphenol hydroxylase-like FAD-dependent oxidoreductase